MPREIHLNAAGPMSIQAVRKFAADIAEATPLRPVVAIVEDAADVVLLDGSLPETTLRVDWRCESPIFLDATGQSARENTAEPSGEEDAEELPEHTVLHYVRTMEALARNVEAASAFCAQWNPFAKRR